MSQRSVTYNLYLNENVKRHLLGIEAAALKTDSAMYQLQSTLRLFGVYAVGRTLFNFGKDLVDVTAKFETLDNVIKFSSANTREYITNTKFLDQIITDLKLPILSTTEAYSKLSAALIGTSLEGEGARKVFEGLSVAARVMHMDSFSTGRAFLAIEQMISKGKVMSEELRRQLGNAMPGALRHFANALGMSQGELMEKMKLGQVSSEEAIPKFAEYLINTFSKGIPNAVKSLQAQQEQLTTEWLRAKQAIGEELRPEIVGLLGDLTDAVKWIKENRLELIQWGKTIVDITKVFLAYKAAIFSIQTVLSAYRFASNAILGTSTAQAVAIQKQTTAYGLQVAAINSMTAALERLNFVQNATNASFIAGAGGVIAKNTRGNRYAMTAGQTGANTAAMAAGGAAVANSTFSGSNIMGFVNRVFIVGMAAELLQQFGMFGKSGDRSLSIYDMLGLTQYGRSDEVMARGARPTHLGGLDFLFRDEALSNQRKRLINEKQNQKVNFGSFYGYDFDENGNLIPLTAEKKRKVEQKSTTGIAGSATLDFSKKDVEDEFKYRDTIKKFTEDLNSKGSIRGNSVTNINVEIGRIAGMENPQFSVKNIQDMNNIENMVGVALAKILTQTINDSQLIKKGN